MLLYCIRLLETPPLISTAARHSSPSRLRRGFFMSSSPMLTSVAAVGGSSTVGVTEQVRLKGVVWMDPDSPVIDFPVMYLAVLGSDRYATLGFNNVDILHHILM